jgi:hypothetical protein
VVEQQTLNLWVAGSSPATLACKRKLWKLARTLYY